MHIHGRVPSLLGPYLGMDPLAPGANGPIKKGGLKIMINRAVSAPFGADKPGFVSDQFPASTGNSFEKKIKSAEKSKVEESNSPVWFLNLN